MSHYDIYATYGQCTSTASAEVDVDVWHHGAAFHRRRDHAGCDDGDPQPRRPAPASARGSASRPWPHHNPRHQRVNAEMKRGDVDNRVCLTRAAQVLYERSEEHTSDLQSLMRISYAVFCLKKNKTSSTTK